MLGSLLSRIIIIIGGYLYPAYSSFKTIRAANVKQYVRWMMYWTVFAIFTAIEHVTDIFISWLPFYYEIKVLFVIWLSSTYTRGSSVIYRKILHPLLSQKERKIDKWIDAKQGQAFDQIVSAGKKGIQVAASTAMSGVSSLNNGQTPNAAGLMNTMVTTLGNMGSVLTTTENETEKDKIVDVDEEFETLESDEADSTSKSYSESDDDQSLNDTRRVTRSQVRKRSVK